MGLWRRGADGGTNAKRKPTRGPRPACGANHMLGRWARRTADQGASWTVNEGRYRCRHPTSPQVGADQTREHALSARTFSGWTR